MKKLLFFYALLFIIAFSSPKGEAAEDNIRYFTLDNGMRFILYRRTFSPTFSACITVASGAKDEKPGKTGIAHFLEHMAFSGTETIGTTDYKKEEALTLEKNALLLKTRDTKAGESEAPSIKARLEEIDKELDRIIKKDELWDIYQREGAAGLNAITGMDMTSYFVSLPANKLELWACLEGERLEKPVFRGFESEKRVIMEERKEKFQVSTSGMLYEKVIEEAFFGTPYGHTVIGSQADLGGMTAADVADFYKEFYSPDKTVCAIVGDIDFEAAETLMRKYFGRIRKESGNTESVAGIPLIFGGEKRVTLKLKRNPHLIIGHYKPTYPDRDNFAFKAIKGLLAGGRTSALHRKLITELGMAARLSIYESPGEMLNNMFIINIIPVHPYKTADIEPEVYKVLETFAGGGIGPEELQKIKNQINTSFLRSLQSNRDMAHNLAYYETVTGSYEDLFSYAGKIETLTAEDITAAFKKYFRASNRVVGEISHE